MPPNGRSFIAPWKTEQEVRILTANSAQVGAAHHIAVDVIPSCLVVWERGLGNIYVLKKMTTGWEVWRVDCDAFEQTFRRSKRFKSHAP